MVSSEQINSLIGELEESGVTQVMLHGHPVQARFDNKGSLALSTRVYHGNNFIPESVRDCLKHPPPFRVSALITKTSLDEKNFQILLIFQGMVNLREKLELKELVDNFCLSAEEWRFWIDDHDKRDLVHVHVK